MRAQVCNARWGNGAAEAEARPAPAAGVSTFFTLRQKSSSTFNLGIFSRNVSSAVGYTLYSVKSNAWRTLAMGGIFFAAKKYAETAGAGSGLDAVVAAAAVIAEVAGDFLINRAAAQREKQLETAEFQALAERNQHLRHIGR